MQPLARSDGIVETAKGRKAQVNPVLCKGDGLCNANCPTNAIVWLEGNQFEEDTQDQQKSLKRHA